MLYQQGCLLFYFAVLLLRRDSKWQELFVGLSMTNRMKDVELFLRFFALVDAYKMQRKITALSPCLNEFMGEHRELKDEGLAPYRNEYDSTVSFVYDTFRKPLFADSDVQSSATGPKSKF